MKTKNYRILEITNALDVKRYKIQKRITFQKFKYLNEDIKILFIIFFPIIIIFRLITKFLWRDLVDNIETYETALKGVDEYIFLDLKEKQKKQEEYKKNKIKSIKKIRI